MIKTLQALLLTAVVLVAGCGKSEPPIEVNESKVAKPTDESGDVALVKRTFTVNIAAPTPAWALKISEIYVVEDEVWVLADLTQQPAEMVAQVVTPLTDSVTVEAPDVETVTYVIGKTGGWTPEVSPTLKLISSKDQIAADLANGFKIWPK